MNTGTQPVKIRINFPPIMSRRSEAKHLDSDSFRTRVRKEGKERLRTIISVIIAHKALAHLVHVERVHLFTRNIWEGKIEAFEGHLEKWFFLEYDGVLKRA